MEEDSFRRKLWLWFLDFAETIVIALAIFVIMYRFLFQPHEVKGNSMYDNYHDGEYLLTDKISYRFHLPQRDEVVIFKAPKNEDYDYIKRIIGLPGDQIKIESGRVYVNNQLLDESGYLGPSVMTQPGYFSREGINITVTDDNYYVLGDNRNNSSDSRDWGLVPKTNIIGKAWLRYWPITKLGIINKYPKLSTR
jgi:signal peptidase I